jgi:hypothetical protein
MRLWRIPFRAATGNAYRAAIVPARNETQQTESKRLIRAFEAMPKSGIKSPPLESRF